MFKALFAIIRNPWLLNNVLADNKIWKNYVDKKYEKKHPLPVVEIDELFPAFSESVGIFAFLDGGSLPTDIGILQAISKRFKDCKYFEIGTWRGESVVNVADYAAECYTLNLSRMELIASGEDEKYADLHGFFSKQKKNIVHLEGNSLTYDFSKLNKKFDLVFIDGDHRYEFVKNDTEKIFNHLIHDNSIVVWHDYGYDPVNIRYEVLAGILDGIPSQFRDKLYQVSNTLCAIFTREKLNSKKFVSPVIPNKEFKLNIEVRRIMGI